MDLRRHVAALASLVVFAGSTQALRAQQEPDEPAVRRAIADLIASGAAKPARPIVIREVTGCYPGAGDDAGRFLCLVSVTGPGGEAGVQPIALERQASAGWKAVPSMVPTPACPSKAVAEPLFQQRMGASAKVTDAPNADDGVFTDERGLSRDRKGPMRLMCAFEVTGRLGPSTVVAYFTYKNGKYGLDADYEMH